MYLIFSHLAVCTNTGALISNSRVHIELIIKISLFLLQNTNHRSNHFVLKVKPLWALFPKIETLLKDD